jgi:hypothetical protein
MKALCWGAIVLLNPDRAICQPPAKVVVGAYVNDIQAVDLREHSYAVDLYLWFRWTDRSIEPHATLEAVNPFELWGHVRQPLYDQPIELPSGELYQVLRIQGRFSHKFFFHNYPFDRQQLTIEFEDGTHETNRLVWVADQSPIAINPEFKLPGYNIAEPQLSVANFDYPTAFGDTRRTDPNQYSRIKVVVPIRRPIFTSCVKMLLPVLCVLLGASLMLRMRVAYVDARVGIGITALLTVVAIQLASNDTMPSVDYLILMDKIHLSAYAHVLAGLWIALLTIRLLDKGQAERAEVLQRRGFWAIGSLMLIATSLLVGMAIKDG